MSDAIVNAFIGRTDQPSDADLHTALGPAKPVWDELVAYLATHHEVTIQEWSSYSPKAGWALRLKQRKRTILWLSPCAASFCVTFILGEKAMQAARQSSLSARAIHTLDQAPKYAEGSGVRLQIRGPRDIPTVKKLAVVKLEN